MDRARRSCTGWVPVDPVTAMPMGHCEHHHPAPESGTGKRAHDAVPWSREGTKMRVAGRFLATMVGLAVVASGATVMAASTTLAATPACSVKVGKTKFTDV